jgi:hypothetical protein
MSKAGPTRRSVLGAAFAVIAAAAGVAGTWGFTVDDALISVQYARNLIGGTGWRFQPAAAATDGVTPLPWPVLLAPLAHGDALAVLDRARVVGVVAWLAAAIACGVRASKIAAPVPWVAVALALTGASLPACAYASSGMETPVAAFFATLAAISDARPRRAALFAGLAAAFRPELAPFALVLAAGFGLARGGANERRETATASALALAPPLACIALRLAAFGRPAPLAVLAKPSDLDHGLAYAGAGVVVALTPLLALAPRALVRERGPGVALALAVLAHAVVVALVGGDWMPYARLFGPIVPAAALAAVHAAPHAHRAALALRGAVAIGLAVHLWASAAPPARRVLADRRALVERARPLLAGAHAVASVDVGWLSAATDARIVDLAGLTDPAFAALPGGHTSKRVDAGMLLERGVDVVLLYGTEAGPSHGVGVRLVGSPSFTERYAPAEILPLGDGGAFYRLFRAKPAAP